MTVTKHDFEIITEATFASVIELSIVDSCGDEIEPFDLTGWEGLMQIRSYADCSEVVKEITTDANGGMSFSGNEIAITVNDFDISPGKYVYDIRIKKVDEIKYVLRGFFIVLKNVSRQS